MTNYSPVRANLLALPIFFLLLAVVLGPHRLFWGGESLERAVDFVLGDGWLIAIAVFLVSVVAHELLHAVGFGLAGINRRDVRFGVHWKMLAPYASTRVPMTAAQYRVATILPGIVLGVLPAVLGIASGRALITLYGATLLAAACGDALILWAIRRLPAATMVRDCEHNVGCEVLEPGVVAEIAS